MTAGHDDQEQLIRRNSVDTLSNHEKQYPDPTYGSTEHTSITFAQPKNYGSLTQATAENERLNYSWYNLDVFGEVHAPESSLTRASKQLKSYMCGDKRIPAPRKHLLKNVCGVAYSGEILAVLGSSGAGKTTLLNALAFRSPIGVQVSPSAVRLLNGCPVDARAMRARCAYVQQDDLFISSLTAREHLIFQAMLRMPRTLPYRQKIERVNQVIQELSLNKCQRTVIGAPGRIKGLSGGERKRLAFASEALTDPPLLLCDEPTSGLDSFMAHNVLQVLKGLSEKGKTIILTIHQPSSELFALFDRICLMAEGRVAFLGTSDQAAEFFAQVEAPCPANYNPADFYVQVLAVVPGKELESREKIGRICDNFAVGRISKQMSQMFQKDKDQPPLKMLDEEISSGYRASWCTQFRAILWRAWLTVLKEPLLVKVRLIQTITVSLLIGVIFLHQELTQDGVMNINGAIFLFLTNMTFQNVFAVINVFCSELPVFMRERRSRLYRCDTYFLGKTLAELPLFLAVPFIFTSIVYPMVGLRGGITHYLVALALVSLVANVSTSFGYLISCLSSSTSMALSVGPPVIIPFLLFGGFFLNSGSVPSYFTWLSYLSWFRYGNEGLLINQWADVVPGEIICTRSNTTCPASGRVVLETLNFSENDLSLDFVGLIALIFIFRFTAYLALFVRSSSKE